MSISPPSDILLDSLRGVDPAVRNASIEKLRKFSQTVITPANSEPSFKNHVAVAQANALPFHASSALTQMRNQAVLQPNSTSPAASAMQQFEGAFLKNFIETMQPSKTASLYGTGTAGSVWQSFMADAVAQKVSEAGGVGIAKALEARVSSEAPAANPQRITSDETSAGTPVSSEPAQNASSELGFFEKVSSFFSSVHSLFSSLLPTTAQAARRDEYSLTVR